MDGVCFFLVGVKVTGQQSVGPSVRIISFFIWFVYVCLNIQNFLLEEKEKGEGETAVGCCCKNE